MEILVGCAITLVKHALEEKNINVVRVSLHQLMYTLFHLIHALLQPVIINLFYSKFFKY